MKNLQENLATLTISSLKVTTSTRQPTTRAWISADISRQDGAICSKNRKIVPYHGSARIPRLTVSLPDYDSWFWLIFILLGPANLHLTLPDSFCFFCSLYLIKCELLPTIKSLYGVMPIIAITTSLSFSEKDITLNKTKQKNHKIIMYTLRKKKKKKKKKNQSLFQYSYFCFLKRVIIS